MPTILLWSITGLLMLLGLAGTVVPGIPGVGFVFAGMLFYGIVTDFTSISIGTMTMFGIVTAAAWLANYAGSVVGARAGGGKKPALIGTIVGAIIGGIAAGPGGIIAGAFFGGLAGALFEGQSHEQALKIALLATAGVVGAAVFQVLLAAVMIIAFLIAVFT